MHNVHVRAHTPVDLTVDKRCTVVGLGAHVTGGHRRDNDRAGGEQSCMLAGPGTRGVSAERTSGEELRPPSPFSRRLVCCGAGQEAPEGYESKDVSRGTSFGNPVALPFGTHNRTVYGAAVGAFDAICEYVQDAGAGEDKTEGPLPGGSSRKQTGYINTSLRRHRGS